MCKFGGTQHLVRNCALRTCPVSFWCLPAVLGLWEPLSPPYFPCGSVALCLFPSSDEDSGHVEYGATLLQVTSESLDDIFKGPVST